jgi:uncharacterized membrane protein YphA (DoxX/SURF4 family)
MSGGLENNRTYIYMNSQQLSVILFFVMFIYSGINKIFNFSKKVSVLALKTGLPLVVSQFGMLCVIILELIGSAIMILYFFRCKYVDFTMVKFINNLFLLFLIVVTFLYHPPWQTPIPFLSNLTTFAGLLLLKIILTERNKSCYK